VQAAAESDGRSRRERSARLSAHLAPRQGPDELLVEAGRTRARGGCLLLIERLTLHPGLIPQEVAGGSRLHPRIPKQQSGK
jgi:hypothetical protein